jgi:hypothetical protein
LGDTVVVLIVIAGFFVTGLIAVLFPTQLQRSAIRDYETKLWRHYVPGSEYVRGRWYVPVTRFIGVVGITMSLLLTWLWWK